MASWPGGWSDVADFDREVARWEGFGVRWIQLYMDSQGYTYKTDNGGDALPPNVPDDDTAITYMEESVIPGMRGNVPVKRVR